jgi:CheY-like chemotaxis protein
MSPVISPNLKVLVADDDPSLLRLVTTIVESEGLIPIAAVDGRDAYRLLKSSTGLGAVIVDIKMPYIKGSDLVKFMRSNPRFANIPVIVMTGEVEANRSAKSMAAGAVAFLPKPFKNSQLRVILRTFFNRNPPK